MRKAVKGNIPNEHILEFFVKPEELEIFKQYVRKETNNNCYFFSKKVDEIISVICFYNIKGIAEVFEKEKEKMGLAKEANLSISDIGSSVLKHMDFKQMDFQKTVSFGTKTDKKENTIKSKGKISPKEFILTLEKSEQKQAILAFKTLKESTDTNEKLKSKEYLEKIGYKF